MKDRWGMLPLGEPRCENCREPLTRDEEAYGRCDGCAIRIARCITAVDRAVQRGRDAA